MNKKKLSLIVVPVLVILGIGIGVKVHMDNIEKEKQEQVEEKKKEQTLKKIEDEIVEDLAKRYKNIDSIQFYAYSVSPMGTLTVPVAINHKDLEEYGEDYDMDANDKHPRLSDLSMETMGEKGTSDIKNIKISYNFKEFGK